MKNTKLSQFFEKISPTELAKLRDKRQDTSTRDKKLLLKKIKEVEDILLQLNVEISLKKNENNLEPV